MAPPIKLGTYRVTFYTEHLCINQKRDLLLLVAPDGPIIPSRLFEGPWTAFVRGRVFDGDNGVVFSDAMPLDAQAEVKTKASLMRQTAFPKLELWGTFQLEIEIYDWRQAVPVRAFLNDVHAGFIRIGAYRTTDGQCEIRETVWLDETGTLIPDYLPRPAIKTTRGLGAYSCLNGHPQTATIRLQGGECPDCCVHVPPQWYHQSQANRPWQGHPRQWGDRTPLLESVEEIVNLQLGLEFPIDWRRLYIPPTGGMLELDTLHVQNYALRFLGLPQLPFKLSTCLNWRSRVDVLLGLAIIFKSQQGVTDELAATAAAVIHRFLTGFHLTPENSGDWYLLVKEVLAESVYQSVWKSIAEGDSFQDVVESVVYHFGLEHNPSAEYGVQNAE